MKATQRQSMYSIGQFSTITSITVKALRYYHRKAVLVPSIIDSNNGYRYYNHRDLEKARIIVTLKSLRFSLNEIEVLLKQISEDTDIIETLKSKKLKVLSDIEDLKSIDSALTIIIKKAYEANKMGDTTTDIHIKTIAEQLVVSSRWQGPYSDTGKAMGRIYRAGGRHSAGPALNLCYDGEHKDVADIESCLPIKKTIKTKLDCRSLAEQQCVCYVHKGPYENLGESYKAVFDYMKQHGLTMILPTREVYLKGPGMIFSGNPEKYLTEIQIPFVKTQHASQPQTNN